MDALKRAVSHVNTASLILDKTIPLTENPKLMVGIIENLNKAIVFTLYHILETKDIDPRSISIKDAFSHMPEEYIDLARDISEISKKHKESPVEFIRNKSLIICSDNYNIRTLSEECMKKYISQTTRLISEVETWKAWNKR